MAISLRQPPGFFDLPATAFTAGQPLLDSYLAKINSNAKFGAVRVEVFYDEFRDGESVPLPISTIDRYIYSRAECIYAWTVKTTFNPQSGRPSASGALLMQDHSVDPSTGEVTSWISYYVQGGAQTDTRDGTLAVWTIAVRGRGEISMASQPAFADVADAAFSLDAAAKQSNFRNLSENARRAAVRHEVFIDNGSSAAVWQANQAYAAGALVKPTTAHANGHWFKAQNSGTSGAVEPDWTGSHNASLKALDGTVAWVEVEEGYSNGQTVPLPVSPDDGYAYARSELTCFPFWIYTGKADRSGPSGSGRIRVKSLSVNPTTGVVTTSVSYWDGHTETVTTDGRAGVIVFAQRTNAAMAAQAATFIDLDDPLFLAGAKLADAYVKELNQNAKFAILRPEVFAATYTNGQLVLPPTSPVDGYVYARAELSYLWIIQNTGAGTGAIRAENVRVDASTGLVSVETDVNVDGDGTVQNFGGTLNVITIARRSHFETASVSAPASTPAAGSVNPPAAPTWVDFSGDKGIFSFEISVETGQGQAIFSEVQLASDSAYTLDLRTVSMGAATVKTLRFPLVTRFARARSKFVDSDWSVYANFGAPTAVYSGHPADDLSPGIFNPADPRLGVGVRMVDVGGLPRHIFRYDDPAHTLDLVIDGTTYARVKAVSANQATTSSIQPGAVSSSISQQTNSYVNVTGTGGGSNGSTQVATVTLTPNGGYVSLRFYCQIASTNTSALGYGIWLYKGTSAGTLLASFEYGSFITAGDGKYLTVALEGIDTSPGTSSQQYTAYANTNSGGTASLIPVILIAQNAKV